MKVVIISVTNAIKAYAQANESEKTLLKNLLGDDAIKSENVQDSITDFDSILSLSGRPASEFEPRKDETDDELAYRQAKVKSSSIMLGFQGIKTSVEHFEDFIREHPGSKGAKLFNGYIKRLLWIKNDLITTPELPEKVIQGIKEEWNSDVFATSAIAEKVALLNPKQRDMVEFIVDKLIEGEKVNVEMI